jgi:AcrR family transcriptional regulator
VKMLRHYHQIGLLEPVDVDWAMTRRDRNAEATRHDILPAGHEIFSQHRYFAVSGLQVCNRAGVTRGALQHHFGSKLGVFMAVFEGLNTASPCA